MSRSKIEWIQKLVNLLAKKSEKSISHRFLRFTLVELTILNELTYKIRGAIFKVHAFLGPGLLESVYGAALSYELSSLGLSVQSQLGLPVEYNGIILELGFRIDILVNDEVII